MLRTDLIEHFAKKQEALNVKNKASNSNIEKPYYYFNSDAVLKAANANSKGNINARDMLGTQTVFPSEEASATSGEYLIYVMPRFVKGSTVYRLFNTEDSKEIKNTVKVKDSSLDNYIYQIDTSSTPDQVELEGETAKLEDTDRAVERNTQNRIKPIQEGETPEQYQERFMKEYHDIVRDINGALQEIDPEQVVKQWQQKQKEIEAQREDSQAKKVLFTMQQGLQSFSEAINDFSENSCSLQAETAKSIFFENSQLKAVKTPPAPRGLICKNTRNVLAKFFYEMGIAFEGFQFTTKEENPFKQTSFYAYEENSPVRSLIDNLLKNKDSKEKILEIADALEILQRSEKTISSNHKIILLYLLFNDAVSSTETQKPEITNDATLKLWIQKAQEAASQLQIEGLVNNLQTNRDVPYVESIQQAEQIIDLAKALVQLSFLSIDDSQLTDAQKREKILKFGGKPDRLTESFFGLFSLGMIKVQLGKHLLPNQVPNIELQVGLTREEQTFIQKTREKGFRNADIDTRKLVAQILQKQVPPWIFSPENIEDPTAEELEKLFVFNKEGAKVQEEDPLNADLSAFSTGKNSTQFVITDLIDTSIQTGDYKNKEFEAFIDVYVDNLSKKLGISSGCKSYKGMKHFSTTGDNSKNNEESERKNNEMDICDELVSHVQFILGRKRTSSTGSENDRGETFEEILMLDNLFNMLPTDLSKIRFNNLEGLNAVKEYLRCNSSNKRDYLSQTDKSNIKADQPISYTPEIQENETQQTITVSEDFKQTASISEISQSLEKAIKDATDKDAFKESVQAAKTQVEQLLDENSKLKARPMFLNAQNVLVESETEVTLFIKEQEYLTSFYEEINPILERINKAKTKKDKKKLERQLQDVVFKFLAFGIVNQENNTSHIKTTLSALTNFLEKTFSKNNISDENKKLIKKAFGSKINHLVNFLKKYSDIGTINLDAIETLVATEKVTVEQVSEIVGQKETLDKLFQTTILNGQSIDTWLTSAAELYAQEFKAQDIDVEAYIDHFKDKFIVLMQQAVNSGTILDKETFLDIIYQSKVSGTRALLKLMSPQTEVTAIYTEETQAQFLESLKKVRQEGSLEAVEIPTIISGKTERKVTSKPVSGASLTEARSARKTAALNIQNYAKTTIQPGELESQPVEVATLADYTKAFKEIFGEEAAKKYLGSKNTLKGYLDTLIKSQGDITDIAGNALSGEAKIQLRKAISEDRAFSGAEGQIKVKKKLNRNGSIIKKETDELDQDGNPTGTIVEQDMHTIELSFTYKGQTYTIVIDEENPPAPSPFSKKQASIITIDNIILKAVKFDKSAQQEKSMLDKKCPAVNIGGKINTLALLAIEDSDGVTFFNISKLEGIPGKSSGFADIAHFKIKGLKFDSQDKGRYSRRQNTENENEKIGLEMNVVEGKVGGLNPTLASFGRIEAIQNGVIESVLGEDTEALTAISSARFNVFVGRAANGRVSYARAKAKTPELQFGRISIAKKQQQDTENTQEPVTQSITSNKLHKILKSIWI